MSRRVEARDGFAAPRMRTEGSKTFELAVPADWTRDAQCLDDWKGFASDDRPTRSVAEQLCDGCPVKAICLETALAEEGDDHHRFRGGIRGGLTPRQRYELSESQNTGGRPVKDHCHNHHDLNNPDNVRITKTTGVRRCVVCERASVKWYRAKASK